VDKWIILLAETDEIPNGTSNTDPKIGLVCVIDVSASSLFGWAGTFSTDIARKVLLQSHRTVASGKTIREPFTGMSTRNMKPINET